jgi:hypothetical protein
MKSFLLAGAPALALSPTLLLLPADASLGQRVVLALQQLHQASPALAWAGWLHVGFVALALVLLPLDHRLITGAPAWLKPLKFALSGLAYTWALGWLLASLPAVARPAATYVGWGVGLSLLIEVVIIFVQAGRGVSSHYNTSSGLNALLFGTMGVFIAIQTLLSVWAAYLVWHYPLAGSAGYVWGVRLGLPLSILGAVVGGYMIGQLGHTVGAPDGGPGLPGLGWSTRAGDIRIAHFLGLHALQALPVLGWAVGRWQPGRAAALTWLGAALYAAAVAALLWQALAGQPLWRAR